MLGIHYIEEKEPAFEEEKNVLRERGRLQPKCEQPLDWVFVGSIANKDSIVSYHSMLLPEDYKFDIATDIAGSESRIMAGIRRLKSWLSAMFSRQ